MNAVWLFPIIGAVFGGLTILFTMVGASTAPQEAAGYAMACALAIVPYVFARAMHMLHAPKLSEEINKVIKAIENGPKQED